MGATVKKQERWTCDKCYETHGSEEAAKKCEVEDSKIEHQFSLGDMVRVKHNGKIGEIVEFGHIAKYYTVSRGHVVEPQYKVKEEGDCCGWTWNESSLEPTTKLVIRTKRSWWPF